jgi:hypothetical protein
MFLLADRRKLPAHPLTASLAPLKHAHLATYARTQLFDPAHPHTCLPPAAVALSSRPAPLQVGAGFNRDYWARFERFVQDLSRRCDDVWVVTGPLYLPQPAPGGAPGTYVMNHPMIGVAAAVTVSGGRRVIRSCDKQPVCRGLLSRLRVSLPCIPLDQQGNQCPCVACAAPDFLPALPFTSRRMAWLKLSRHATPADGGAHPLLQSGAGGV